MFSKFDLKKYLPWESRFIELRGYRMHYFDVGADPAGEKPVVVLLHGNPTWSFYFRDLIKMLAGEFRVIAPDYIGMGLSDHPNNVSFRASDRVADIDSLLSHLAIKRYSLVMHDWGGAIGTRLATQHVNQIDKLVYLNTTLTETEGLPGIIRISASTLVGKTVTKYTKRFLKITTDFGAKQKLKPEVRQGYFYPYRTIRRRHAIWGFVSDIPFSSRHPSWSEMLRLAEDIKLLQRKPVLVLWGLRDPCFHRDMLSQVARHYPGAEVVEFPDAGHLVLEDGGERACRRIKEFLCKSSAQDSAVEQSPNISQTNQCANYPALYFSFRSIAEQLPDQEAVIEARETLGGELRYQYSSYSDLFALVSKYERALVSFGLAQGDRVVLLVSPGIEFLALAYAVMGRGAIPVFMDPGMGRENLLKCIAEVEAQGFIGVAKAQLLRYFSKDEFKRFKFNVVANEWIGFGGKPLRHLKSFANTPLAKVEVSEKDTGLIAFTSGATGTPKGVIFTNEMLVAQSAIFRDRFGLEMGTRDLPLLPVFSLFSLAIGVASIFAPLNPARPLDLNPLVIGKIINDLRVNSSFGSPTLWSKISDYCVRYERTFTSLKKVFMAGAPVARALVKRLQPILPNCEIFTPYGATEALPVTLIDGKDLVSLERQPARDGGFGTLVGKNIPEVQLKVIRETSDVLPDMSAVEELGAFEIGEIIVHGRNVSPAYLRREESTRLAKINAGAEFWHRMGDVGYKDGDGNLYFCGRKAHVLRLGDRKLYSDPVENIFNSHPKVARSALISLHAGAQVAVAIEPLPEFFPSNKEQEDLFSAELRALGQKHPITGEIKKFVFHPSFPVDPRHNAKIFREKLGVWASAIVDASPK